jgi:hypothetical protein
MVWCRLKHTIAVRLLCIICLMGSFLQTTQRRVPDNLGHRKLPCGVMPGKLHDCGRAGEYQKVPLSKNIHFGVTPGSADPNWSHSDCLRESLSVRSGWRRSYVANRLAKPQSCEFVRAGTRHWNSCSSCIDKPRTLPEFVIKQHVPSDS